MNLALVILVIWQLESSQGKNMKHPQPENVGHLGMSIIAIEDINQHYKYRYHVVDTLNKNVAFTSGTSVIGNDCPRGCFITLTAMSLDGKKIFGWKENT